MKEKPLFNERLKFMKQKDELIRVTPEEAFGIGGYRNILKLKQLVEKRGPIILNENGELRKITLEDLPYLKLLKKTWPDIYEAIRKKFKEDYKKQKSIFESLEDNHNNKAA